MTSSTYGKAHEVDMLDLERIRMQVSPSRSTVAPLTDQDLLSAKLCQSFVTGNSGALTGTTLFVLGISHLEDYFQASIDTS